MDDIKGIDVKGFMEMSFLDYPGKLASIVFVSKCNFRCPFCFNGELVFDKIENIEQKRFFDFLDSKKGWIDGVIVSGGEPTLHPGLKDFIKVLKERGLAVKLATNGSMPDVLKELLDEGLLDCVAMDVKAPFKDYQKVTKSKVSVEDLKKSIAIIMKKAPDYEFRTTVVPKYHKEKDLIAIAKQVKGSKKFYLQQFVPEKTMDPSMRKEKTYSESVLKELAEKMKPYVQRVEVRS